MSSALVPGGPGWAASGASGSFTMDPGWLPYHPRPSTPDYAPPPGAIDQAYLQRSFRWLGPYPAGQTRAG